MSVENALVKQEPEAELDLKETTEFQYQVPIKLEMEFKTEVKSEPCESADSKNGEELYTDHAVKDELVLGPVRVQSPNTVAPSVTSDNTGACNPQHTASTSLDQTQAPTHKLNASPPFKVKYNNETISVLPPPPLSYQSRYVCQICQKDFARTDLLRIHKRTHTGEKPYSCNVCSREFAQLAHLKGHVMIHTGEKPHRCDRCTMGFIQLGSLKRHQRTHAGEKPHCCNVCGKRFTRKGHLIKHTLARHDKRP